MNIARGIIAGLMGVLVGVIAPVIIIGLYTILSWYFNDTHELIRQDDISSWRKHALHPLVGVAIYFGLSAWASYIPMQNYNFTKTLLIIFLIAIPLTMFLAALELNPTRYKDSDVNEIYFSEFLFLLTPPLLVSCILIAFRYSVAHNVDVDGKPDVHSIPT